jgi:aspartyl-tRNA(Asn)/glutamyl-tRNA(Gln) amidotransferase subunit A
MSGIWGSYFPPSLVTIPKTQRPVRASYRVFDDISSGLADFRIGLAPGLHHPPLQPDHEAVFQLVIGTISRDGAKLRELQTPAPGEIRSTFTTIQMAEAYDVHTRLLGTFPAKADEYGSDVRARLEAASDISLEQYLSARESAARLRRQFEIALANVDVMITPISGGGPSTINDPDAVEHCGSRIPFRDLVMNYTVPQDLFGLPACAVRAGFDKDGLPVGIQVTAPSGREDIALRFARSLQVILGNTESATIPLALGR